MNNRRLNAGFTLIEVMIAIVIFSIGLLGVAAMQFVGLRDSNRSNDRSVATVLAYDIIDRIRANPQGAQAGGYEIDPTAGNHPSAPTVAGGAYPEDHCKTDFTGTATADICSSDEMAAADAYDWFISVQNALPGGLAEVSCTDSIAGDGITCSQGSTYTVTILWDDERSGDTGLGCDPTDPDDLFCVSVTTEI